MLRRQTNNFIILLVYLSFFPTFTSFLYTYHFTCPGFKCDQKCLDYSSICDGIVECDDGSDESEAWCKKEIKDRKRSRGSQPTIWYRRNIDYPNRDN
ncbi:unnamed protein product [Gordionus sp. m RMFG-2023]